MTTQARINDEGIPEHKHPGKTTWHWACAGHYVDGQMTIWDGGEKHRAADAGNPTWPRGATPPMRDLYRKALTRQIVHHVDGHVEYNDRPQREM